MTAAPAGFATWAAAQSLPAPALLREDCSSDTRWRYVWSLDARTDTTFGMKSRGHPKDKTRYHVGKWPAYERALVQRGDVTLWRSADVIEAWKPAPSGRRGGQRTCLDRAIETALPFRLGFKLPRRQAEGVPRSVLSLLRVDLHAPDHPTLSRRRQHLPVELHVGPPTTTAAVSRRRPRADLRDDTIWRVLQIGRRRWKPESGYHRQARGENACFRYRSIMGDRLRARRSHAQAAEAPDRVSHPEPEDRA